MLRKLIILITAFIFCSGIVLGVDGVTQTDNFYTENGEPLTGVQSELYTSDDHEHIHSMNSGDSNSITFEYPYNSDSTEQNPDYYDHFLFKECYLPLEYEEEIWGYGVHLEYDNNFEKADSCHSPIDSFSVTNDNHPNEPVVVDVQANLEADAHSAFTDAVLNWFPEGYEDYYSAETEITVEILHDGNVVNTQTKTKNIMMDTSENVQFSWTPEQEGDFTARISTDVTDCQCESSQDQQSSKDFEVWADRPFDECYTLIQNLVGQPEFPTVGDSVELTFDKISNYADTNYDKTPVPTDIDYEITDSNNNVADNGQMNLEANSNGQDYEQHSFDWQPQSSGTYNIEVTGVADSSLCDGKTNPEDTANLQMVVDAEETHDVTFEVVNSDTNDPIEDATVNLGALTGTTDSTGTVTFDMSPGTYSWSVSADGFSSDSGSVNVDSDETVEVSLTPVENEYSVTFNVIDASTGLGVEGASVELGSESATTNQNGRVVFDGVEEGDYDWEITKSGYYNSSGSVTADSDKTIDVSLQAEPEEYDVTFNVENTSGSAVSGAEVELDGSTQTTDSSGEAVFDNVEEGDYDWEVTKSGYESEDASVSVDSDETVDVTLEAYLPPELDVSDQLLEPESGMNDNAVDLWNYTTYPDTQFNQLNYTIKNQSNTSVVDCQLDSNRYLDCEVMSGVNNTYSEISMQVDDGQETDDDTFKVWIVEDNGIDLLNPECGDVVSGDVEVSWQAVVADSIDIEYSLDDGNSWETIAENEQNDGSYMWDTENYENQADYLLRVVAKDSDGNVVNFDVTDCPFTVDNERFTMEKQDLQRHSIFIAGANAMPEQEFASAGENVRLRLNLENNGDYDLENVQVNAIAHDFGSRASAGPFDLEMGEEETRNLVIGVPEYVQPGVYPVRISIYDDKAPRVKYRHIRVVE